MRDPARSRGFTMIEVLYVISIMAVLAAILFPVFARAREHARRATCASNLMQIGAALSLYARDCDGHFPPKNNDFAPTYPYAGSVSVFYCPSDSQEHKGPIWRVAKGSQRRTAVLPSSSYVYKGGLTNDDRADIPIASEVQAFHTAVANVLYLGGYVKAAPGDGFKPIVPPAPEVKEPQVRGPSGPPGPAAAPMGPPKPMQPVPGGPPSQGM